MFSVQLLDMLEALWPRTSLAHETQIRTDTFMLPCPCPHLLLSTVASST